MSLKDDVLDSVELEDLASLERKLTRTKATSEERRRENERLKRSEIALLEEVDRLKAQVSFVENTTTLQIEVPKWVKTVPKTKKKLLHSATACLVLSDLHLDEVVDPGNVENINGYNREIAEMRFDRVINKTVDVAKTYVAALDFEGMVLMLGGDMLTGDIHDELARTNEATVQESIVHWVPKIASAIEYLADEFGRLYIPAVRGNHDRSAKKTPHKKQAQEAFTWIMYQWLADRFKDDSRVEFAIAEAPDISFPIYDTKFLLTHGDQFSGGGGIAGIYCLGEGTKVLNTSLEWVNVESLVEGDPIVGFDEMAGPRGTGRKFAESVVESNDIVYLDSYVLTANGHQTVASSNHMWLVRRGNNVTWVKTSDLIINDRIISVGETWETDNSRDAGWLAGIYDGEGCVEANTGRLSVSQNPGLVLDKVSGLLDTYGYSYSRNHSLYSDAIQLRSDSNKAAMQSLRMLGTIRPERLLAQSRKVWEGKSTKACVETTVEAIEHVGVQKLYAIGTSTKTLISNGMLSHNSPISKGEHRKQLRNASLGQPFDYMVMGHFHQLIWGQKFIINGSLKGYDEYAYNNNLPYEHAQQAFWIVTPEHGITMHMPIFAEGPDEPWK